MATVPTDAQNMEDQIATIKSLLRWMGEDPDRDGLLDTPKRVLKMWRELTSGYHQSPEEILSRTFEQSYDEMIIVRDISYYSMCEHHMLPFYGKAHVGYIPKGRVVGLSKIVRLVHCFARRLQIQERMSCQIGEAIQTHLDTQGVGVILKAKHLCMACRGVRDSDAEMVTSVMLGVLREKVEARQEFLRLIS